jgi:hypothetical protein
VADLISRSGQGYGIARRERRFKRLVEPLLEGIIFHIA